jgi:hypothetical protein
MCRCQQPVKSTLLPRFIASDAMRLTRSPFETRRLKKLVLRDPVCVPSSCCTTSAASLVAEIPHPPRHMPPTSSQRTIPAPPIVRCATHATWRIKARGSNRYWMKAQWQVTTAEICMNLAKITIPISASGNVIAATSQIGMVQK